MKKKSNLKPCPFCGSRGIRSMLHNDLGGPFVGKPHWGVDCLDCDAQVQSVFYSDVEFISPNETAQEICERMWNMRRGWRDVNSRPKFTPASVAMNIQKFWTPNQKAELLGYLRMYDQRP